MSIGKAVLALLMIVFLIIVAVGGLKIFLMQQKRIGTNYYVKIDSNSESREGAEYIYHLKGFDKDGKPMDLEFYGMDGHPINIGAYLKLTYGIVSDGSDGVKRWEEISKNKVPDEALRCLDK